MINYEITVLQIFWYVRVRYSTTYIYIKCLNPNVGYFLVRINPNIIVLFMSLSKAKTRKLVHCNKKCLIARTFQKINSEACEQYFLLTWEERALFPPYSLSMRMNTLDKNYTKKCNINKLGKIELLKQFLLSFIRNLKYNLI